MSANIDDPWPRLKAIDIPDGDILLCLCVFFQQMKNLTTFLIVIFPVVESY